MRRKKSTQMVLRVGFLFALVLLLPLATAQGPPVDDEDCLAYAYTQSENHLFLLGENSSMFGQKLMVIHNCDQVDIYLDGFFEASSSENFALQIDGGIHNITISSNAFNATYENVVFYPDRLNWEFEYRAIEEAQPQFIDIEIAALQTNWAVGIGIIIVWVLTTYVYWSLISSYVDRNFIEEVVQ